MRNTFSDEDVNAVARLISHDRFGPWKVEKLTFKKSSAKSLTYGFTSHGKEYVLKLYPTMARYVEKEMRALDILWLVVQRKPTCPCLFPAREHPVLPHL